MRNPISEIYEKREQLISEKILSLGYNLDNSYIKDHFSLLEHPDKTIDFVHNGNEILIRFLPIKWKHTDTYTIEISQDYIDYSDIRFKGKIENKRAGRRG